MTFEEAIILINTYIVENHNNDITANVLNPVLVAITNAGDETIGDLEDLTTTDITSIVNAINSLKTEFDDLENNGVQLYQGYNDPNVTPPPTYNYADFYMQLDVADDSPITLWQWTGTEWTEYKEVYSKAEIEEILTNYYTKSEIDALLALIPINPTLDEVLQNGNISGRDFTLDGAEDGDTTFSSTGVFSENINAEITAKSTNGKMTSLKSDGVEIATNAGGTYKGRIKSDNISANRDYQLPNANGTFALIEDLTSIYRTAGSWDASGNTFPTIGTGTSGAIRQGDTYNTTVSGTPAGFTKLDIGDNFYALIDNPGQTAANWDKFESNTDQSTESIRGTGRVVTQEVIEDDASTNDTDFVTTKKFWYGFAKGLTLSSFFSAVTGTLLTGYTAGTNAAISATNTVKTALQDLQAQITNIGSSLYWTKTGDDIKNNNTGLVQVGANPPSAQVFKFSVDGKIANNGGTYAPTYFLDSDNAAGMCNGSNVGEVEFRSYGTSTNTTPFFRFAIPNNINSAVAGTRSVFEITPIIAPTSGSRNTIFWNISPTINQTGGANGTIRGFYFNPTLMALVGELIAIEVVTGKVIIPDGVGANEAATVGQLATIGGAKEPTITASGNVTDFWSGTKTFRNLATDVRAIVLTGLSTASSAVIDATDTVLSALGKLQAQISANVTAIALKAPIDSPTFTGTVTTPAIVLSSETASTLASFDVSKNVKSLATATYPNLTEISYVKGVTSAIQTQLNTKTTILYKDAVPTTPVTGTTAETILNTYLIPANTYSANDIIDLASFRVKCTGAVFTKTMRLRMHTTNTIAGSTVIATRTTTTSALYDKLVRTFTLNGGNLLGINFSLSANTDSASSGSAYGSMSFNPAVDNYLMTTGQLSDAGDSIGQTEFLMKR